MLEKGGGDITIYGGTHILIPAWLHSIDLFYRRWDKNDQESLYAGGRIGFVESGAGQFV